MNLSQVNHRDGPVCLAPTAMGFSLFVLAFYLIEVYLTTFIFKALTRAIHSTLTQSLPNVPTQALPDALTAALPAALEDL